MASTMITPTRMMLKQLKGRLKTARRGHKLMKDKRDELMRRFMDIVRLNKELRERVEQGLTASFASLQVASAIMSPEVLEQALLYPRQSVELGVEFKNIMSVNVPEYILSAQRITTRRRYTPTALRRPPVSLTTHSSKWQRFLRICFSLHR